jgi:23S rRNA pseudouridine2605 synthase
MTSSAKLFRLNQAIAKSGRCSRREADKLISAGRVSLNGRVVTDFGLTVDPKLDQLAIDGKPIKLKQFTYLVMYKPRGVVTTCGDQFGREDVLDLLPAKLRHLRPVGRLDMDSEGLLLFTNDGELTQKVTHPVHHQEKKYLVWVSGSIAESDLKHMAAGVVLSDGPTLPAKVRLLDRNQSESSFELTIREGRNRQIRRMCTQLGYRVTRLVRVGIGGLQLGQMAPGVWRYLDQDEIEKLGT